MKLRNKKTGEIVEWCHDDNLDSCKCYDSLAEICEDWEDYRGEPKTYWFINNDAGLSSYTGELYKPDEEIGNVFSSKEEAKLAVEKLKALKRLKDKGFEFNGYDVANNGDGNICGQAFYKADDYCTEDIKEDLDLLFSQEVKNETAR